MVLPANGEVLFPGWKDIAAAQLPRNVLKNGAVIAASDSRYQYYWKRDGALTLRALVQLFQEEKDPAAKQRYLSMLNSSVSFIQKTQDASVLNDVIFTLDGNRLDKTNWGRPQQDGPALEAIALAEVVRSLKADGTADPAPSALALKRDLDFISLHWRDMGYDTWEMDYGFHFFARMVQRRALLEGARLARAHDPNSIDAARYEREARLLKTAIERHWDEKKGLIQTMFRPKRLEKQRGGLLYRTSGLDISVILGVLHGTAGIDDDIFPPTDDRVQATFHKLVEASRGLPINQKFPDKGISMMRYPEDRFIEPAEPNNSGDNNNHAKEAENGGNPWVLATLASAEYLYRNVEAYASKGVIDVTRRNLPFFQDMVRQGYLVREDFDRLRPDLRIEAADPLFAKLVQAMLKFGDSFVDNVHFHANADGSLSEQIHRETGHMHSVASLTWNYEALLGAMAGHEKAVSAMEKIASHEQLKTLKRFLADGPTWAHGRFEPFGFRKPGNDGSKDLARAAGLEGFFYSKLEMERAHGVVEMWNRMNDRSQPQWQRYWQYLDDLLSTLPWATDIRAALRSIFESNANPKKKNQHLNVFLARLIDELHRRFDAINPAREFDRASIYSDLVRAHPLRPGVDFIRLDDIDETELERVRARSLTNVIWFLDIFEIGESGRWGTGGGSPYAYKGYHVKPELGGDAALDRLIERIHKLGLKIGVDQISHSIALDGYFAREHPEGLLHVVPDQNLTDDQMRAMIPRDHAGHPMMYLLKSSYPEGDRRVSRRILVFHPWEDYSGGMWVDMLLRDYSRRVTREWEARELRTLARRGIDVFRRDMIYDLVNARYYPRVLSRLEQARDAAPGPLRAAIVAEIEAFKARWAALGGAEIVEELTDAVKRAKPDAAVIDEAYAHANDLSRAGSDGIYNKGDFDTRMGQIGLYDAASSRDGRRLREALKNAAYREFQLGGARMVSFPGTHDGGEGNPVDKFGSFYKSFLLATLVSTPNLINNGIELGVGQARMLLGDLSKSSDLAKMVPFDIPVRIKADAIDPDNSAWYRFVASQTQDLAGWTISVLDTGKWETPIVAWSYGRKNPENGKPIAVIRVVNVSHARSNGLFTLKNPLLRAFGAFEPKAGRIYILRDLANLDSSGRPKEYLREGRELRDKGLYIELDGYGRHDFEIEEIVAKSRAGSSKSTQPVHASGPSL